MSNPITFTEAEKIINDAIKSTGIEAKFSGPSTSIIDSLGPLKAEAEWLKSYLAEIIVEFPEVGERTKAHIRDLEAYKNKES